jgi:tRNA(fMet)-specific endonuclease VapC
MNFLLDTCVISDFFKKHPSVTEHLQSASPEQIYISSVTVMEVEYGLHLHPDRTKKLMPLWKDLIGLIAIVPFSPECALAAAKIRSGLKRDGRLIGPYDILIAGSALAHDMVLITSNTNEFNRISDLNLKDWRVTSSG